MVADDSTRSRAEIVETGDARLLVIANATSRWVELPASGRLVVGRAPEAELQIDDDSVSRKHAMVTTRDGAAEIADLDSHNGTRVNGERLAGLRRLAPGDVVQVGDVVLVVYGAPPRGRRELLDLERLRRRIDDEIERAAAYDRELGLVMFAGARAAALEPELRAIDGIAELGAEVVAVLVPELDRDGVAELAARCVARGAARAGIAMVPDDTADASALVAAARTALERAQPGSVVDARATVTTLEVGVGTTAIADPVMVRLIELARHIARADLSVLVRGETGVGKEHVARALHQFSRRAAGPFMTVNCAAVQDTLVESELFGHDKGAFTGAIAAKPGLLEVGSGGTVFLDEVGELTPAMQAKLLRALDAKRITRVGSVVERPIDIRIVAATHRDLDCEVAAGRFRRDLLFRIAGAVVVLPPLRERPLDIALLARRFADEACARTGRPPLRISCGAMRALSGYAWPGNVRELRNAIELATALAADATTLDPWQLPPAITGIAGDAELPAADQRFRPIADELAELERRRMREAIAAANGVLKAAAGLIRMPLRTFHLKAKQYGLKSDG